MTFIWTWLFNHAGQSILFAMFMHGVSNAASGLLPRLIVDTTGDPWFGFKVGAACALIIIVFTRGRLGYPSFTEKEDVTDRIVEVDSQHSAEEWTHICILL
jgi:hypothetical protein